jgi:hypothetical protein
MAKEKTGGIAEMAEGTAEQDVNKTDETVHVPDGDVNENPDAAAEAPDEAADDGATRYPKEELLGSFWYSHRRGFLEGALEDGKAYSHAEVGTLLRGAAGSEG